MWGNLKKFVVRAPFNRSHFKEGLAMIIHGDHLLPPTNCIINSCIVQFSML